MANHADVLTKKHMTVEKVMDLLEGLNQRVFRGSMAVEVTSDNYFSLTFSSALGSPTRSCWLNSRQNFELRHGGGSDFCWWVDAVVCNEIAVAFRGKYIEDFDGNALAVAPNKYDDPIEFLRHHISYLLKPGTGVLVAHALACFPQVILEDKDLRPLSVKRSDVNKLLRSYRKKRES